ncbi:PREDICTED: sodium channel and clathrin linker 1 isoform X1 [Thamnophis sirtalis]|uniref:Sodium channel and clathrin linker 1 isoform X1 n=1 Tax=Thamnophis sirtalis TaxID=35019 RepID=A0A6I9X177_9SAUR|nr:PREDICTED: sodium channel and clathrin linker 1 isoform X1 [Thamnophis sirtalis]XP_013907573.1 PREDICTED: sodium channel and clathrin linker 1 isoform X1 [Thamnophis sirtalis]XP_013907574.1 PREDICTED: sodium channel and clathrin linker 1 isoform X1 [Thamnophis sirtalis]XP_013907575.1 PREDICTED: sodium channel and clathrin linker 1 isoform X1 [Thamnophis sirtalis]
MSTDIKNNGFEDDSITEHIMIDQSSLSPIVAEYDKHLGEMNEQLKYCQMQMKEMRLKLEQVIKENERLHEELKEAIEKQLEALPSGSVSRDATFMDENLVRNLQEQLQLANKEKEHVLELWQMVSRELERLQQIYQEHMTEAQIHIVERQKQNINHVFLKTVTEQNVELEQLRKQQRQSKLDLRTTAAKADEMMGLIEDLRSQVNRKEEEVLTAHEKEEASDKHLKELQSSIKQLETRLCVATKDSKQLRSERTNLEKKIQELQTKCVNIEEEKYDAVAKVRDSMQLIEEANLQKSQAMLSEKQKEEEIETMKQAISQLLQDAALRTRKQVENERKRYNIQISRVTEELTALQMECGEKQSQLERAIREKQAVEEELEKVYREGRGNEADYRKLEELYQRCLNAERIKDDLHLSLQTAQNKIKQLELKCEEEKCRCQENMCKLQSILHSEREKCGAISEERLKLQQGNEQLQKEMENLKKLTMEAQHSAKLKISTMENEHLLKEHGFEIQLKEMEDVNQNSVTELRRLLMAQQKATNRWKEETKKITEITESRINCLKTELSRQKLHTQELFYQLERANEKVIESEKLMREHQEKVNRLQNRLNQAEERATTATQQLSAITLQKKKAAYLIEQKEM